MATIKAYTDIEQSKKLAEILPLDSADMWYEYLPHLECMSLTPSVLPICHLFVDEVPCWSLAALLDVLPKIHGLKPVLDLEENSIQYNGIDLYSDSNGGRVPHFFKVAIMLQLIQLLTIKICVKYGKKV